MGIRGRLTLLLAAGTAVAFLALVSLETGWEGSWLRWLMAALVLFGVQSTMLFMAADRWVVRPLRLLRQAVRRTAEGQAQVEVPVLRGKEVGELAEAIDSMRAKVIQERLHLEQLLGERTRELTEASARLDRLAVTDGLTGVLNHRRFFEAMGAEVLRSDRHQRPLSVLMVDVDHFKKVNDAMGHPAGDTLLRQLAEVLGADLRQSDLIARYGGEEFAILLPESTKGVAMAVAERMRVAVEQRLNAQGTWPIRVTVSIGVATSPEDGRTAEEIVGASNEAMYVAKRQGRNRVVAARRSQSALL